MKKREEEQQAQAIVDAIADVVGIVGDITGEDISDIIVDFANDIMGAVGVTDLKVRLQDSPMEDEEDTEEDTGHYAYTSKEGYLGESAREDHEGLDKYTNGEIKEDIEQAMIFMQNIMDAILDDKARVETENMVIKAKHNNLLNYLKGEK